MRLLLDTHSFLWFVGGSTQLSAQARAIIEDAANQPLLSIASVWEMAIKYSLGRLALAQSFEEFVLQQMNLNGIGLLSITVEHTVVVAKLPFHHRDPFDRLLIGQAVVERLPLLSADGVFDMYTLNRLW